MLLIGYWESVDYWEVTKIAMVGSAWCTIYCTIKTRFNIESKIKVSEGVATAKVLETGHESDPEKSKDSLKMIGLSALVEELLNLEISHLEFGQVQLVVQK